MSSCLHWRFRGFKSAQCDTFVNRVCVSINCCPYPALHARRRGSVRCKGVTEKLSSQKTQDEGQEDTKRLSKMLEGDDLSITASFLEEYAQLKSQILKNSVLAGSFFCLYLASVISIKAGLASAVGSVGSYVYLTLLIKEVDQLNDEEQIPIKRANRMQEGLAKRVTTVLAHYQQSLRPRLLVLVALAVFIKFSDGIVEGGLSTAEQGCLLLGFLSYKISLLLVLYDAVKPRFDGSDLRSAQRPSTDQSDEDAILFDLYGRRKPDIDQKLKDLND